MLDLSESIVGVSPAMAALKAYLPKVARSTATVLISGATGTGKECVAQALHAMGPRSRRPFVAINCAAIPDALVEAELFGHVRGAYTGAVAASEGHFVHADGGTLFLDEIAEMSMHTQARLLRVLESRQVTPVGSSRQAAVDVRVIAATNKSLEDLVRSGRFRDDLFYRLSVARLDIPPLRDRKEDIPLLVAHAIGQLNERERREVSLPDAELLRCLLEHDWPGNVRELRNLVEAVFIDPPSGRIGLADLPPAFRRIFEAYRTTGSTERDVLVSVLRRTNWNKAQAAKELNWSRMTLYRKLAKHHIDRTG